MHQSIRANDSVPWLHGNKDTADRTSDTVHMKPQLDIILCIADDLTSHCELPGIQRFVI